MQKERELSLINNDNQKFIIINNQYERKKDINKIQNDKMKNMIRILENQNNNMIDEIDNILEEDRRMKEVLARKGRINSLLKTNNNTLEKSVNDLDRYINSYQPNNSRYTYIYQQNYI